MKKYFFVFICLFLVINCEDAQDSPINIVLYTKDSAVKYPARPYFVLNSTIYYHLNNKRFAFVNETKNTDCIMEAPDMGNAYVLIYNQTFTYRVDRIALKVYAEHSFNGIKSDIEFQIYHTINGNLPLQSLIGDEDPNDYKHLVISVRFDSKKNKDSKNDVIRQLVKVSEDQQYTVDKLDNAYLFERLSDFDFNRYTNFDEGYYLYKGKATIDGYDENEKMYWIVMENPQYMSVEEFENVQRAFYQNSPGNVITNTKQAVCASRVSGAENSCEDLGITVYYCRPEKDKKDK